MKREENETVKSTLEWKPHGKIPRGRPKKRWIDVVEEDFKALEVGIWKEVVQYRDKW